MALVRYDEREKGIRAETRWEHWTDEHYDDAKMKKFIRMQRVSKKERRRKKMQDQKQQNHNQQKKIALINDFTGFGRCSIAVQLPVISMMKVQCCAVPTAIFSDHTAYDSFYCTDYTAEMEPYIEEWKKLGLKFQESVPGSWVQKSRSGLSVSLYTLLKKKIQRS